MMRLVLVPTLGLVLSLAACREGEPPEGVAPPPNAATANAAAKTPKVGDTSSKKPSKKETSDTSASPNAAADAETAGEPVDAGPRPTSDVISNSAPNTQAIEVLVDCNRATTNFGLAYHEKRFRIATGGGLDQVLRAFSQAVSRQAEFITAEVPVKYCGYADRVECPAPPMPPAPDGMGSWVNVCRPFDEDRAFGGMASAVKYLGQGAASRGGIGMLLTHGLINTADNSERGGADPAQLLAGLPVRGLANALAEGKTSLTLILIENVPFRYGSHGTLKLRKIGKQPVAPMAMLVWGPDDAVMADLINALLTGLEPLSPRAVRLASYDARAHGPVLTPVTLRQTLAPRNGKGEPLVNEVRCRNLEGRDAKCEIELTPPKTTYRQPQRDVLMFDLGTAPAEPPTARAATWRPKPRPEDLRLTTEAHFGEAAGDLGNARSMLFAPTEGAAAPESLYLTNLPPLARCADALKFIAKTVGEGAPAQPLAPDEQWRRTAFLPARCLFSDEVLTQAPANAAARLPSRFVMTLSLDGRWPSATETREELERMMTDAGWPDSDLGSATVPGLRQTVLAVGGLAIEKARERSVNVTNFASIEVTVK